MGAPALQHWSLARLLPCHAVPVLPCPVLPPGVLVVGISLPDRFQAREYRFIRATVFTLLGAWGVVPVTHLLLTSGHVWAIRTAFQLDMLMGLIYLVGAMLEPSWVKVQEFGGLGAVAASQLVGAVVAVV